ncbi:MAG: dihydrofolate reductase family protein [Anaerolineales bacterium]|nr:dihydrofolate reductase family protein [Anaerolineales bacterium]
MGKVILGFTMSLDGFISDQNESVADLYHDLETLRYAKPLQESIQDTGAVVMGRKTFEMGEPDEYAGNYEYQVPIFVVTKHPAKKQPKQTDQLTFTFVKDGIESAIGQAKAAASNKDVTIVGGAEIAAQCLNAKLVDEIHMDIMPILLGKGLQPFAGIDKGSIKLEKISVVETSVRTHLKFRVIK